MDYRVIVNDFKTEKTVCFDGGFNNEAASVLCRYLGISSTGYAFWLPHDDGYDYIATEIRCNGTEQSPHDCDAENYNATLYNCTRDAAVYCQG